MQILLNPDFIKKEEPSNINTNPSKIAKNNSLAYSSANSLNSIDSENKIITKKSKVSSENENQQENWVEKEAGRMLIEASKRLGLSVSDFTKKSLENVELNWLFAEKKRVKNELKLYDSSFQNSHSRMPTRTEKEPMRPLYIYYKRLKSQIEKKESTDNKLEIAGQKLQPPPSTSLQQEAKSQLEILRKEKNELKEKLHRYQVEFMRNYNRKIRYGKDIAPVEKEYERYKELKSEISRLESIC